MTLLPRFALLALAGLVSSATVEAGVGTWTTKGPILPGSLAIASIQAARSESSFVYATTGSVFRSSDNGVTWEPASRGLTPGVHALAIDPNHAGTLYAGYGGFVPIGSNTYTGLFRTSDAGATWHSVNFPHGVQALALDPADPGVLYVAAETTRSLGPTLPLGVFRSTDGGLSWTAPTVSLGTLASLAVDPGQPQVVWATGRPSSGGGPVYRSSDQAATWSLIEEAGTTGHFVAFDPYRAGGVYIGTEQGLFRAPQGRSTPSLVSGSAGLAVLTIAFDPENASVLTLGTKSGVWQTRDGGASFFILPRAPSGEVRTIETRAGSPSLMWAGTEAGLFRSLDGGTSWESANSGIWYTPIKDLIPVSGATGELRAFSGPARALFERTVPLGDWNLVATNLADLTSLVFGSLDLFGTLTPAPSRPERLYLLGGPPLFCGQVLRSDDCGRSWNILPDFTCPRSLAVSPFDADPLFAGGFFDWPSYRSFDGGGSWGETLPPGGLVSPILFAPSQPSTLYLLSTGFQGLVNIFRTTDMGSTWIDLGRPASPGPSALAVDSSDPFLVYAAVTSATVYRSRDGAFSWSRAGDAEGLSLVRSLVVDPTRPNRLWAAGEGGVFVSDDSAATWRAINAGLTDLSVRALVLDPSGETLHVGTASRGVFDLELGPDREVVDAPARVRPPASTVRRH